MTSNHDDAAGRPLERPAFDTAPFRALLKRFREARRWTQERLGDEAGVDHSLVSRLESGRRTPTRDTIDKLAGGLRLAPLERDRLLMAGGFLPRDPASGLAREPALAALYRALTDDRLSAAQGACLRRLLAELAAFAGARAVRSEEGEGAGECAPEARPRSLRSA